MLAPEFCSKLTFIAPDNAEYRRFTDRLLDVYLAACSATAGSATRAARRKWPSWRTRSSICVGRCGSPNSGKLAGPDDDYRLLRNERMELMLAEELFTFVIAVPVETPTGEVVAVAGMNNET